MKLEKLESNISNKIIGIFVSYARVKQDMTIDRLAELAGLNRATIQRIEKGTFNSTLPTHIKLSRALNFNLQKMADFEDCFMQVLKENTYDQ